MRNNERDYVNTYTNEYITIISNAHAHAWLLFNQHIASVVTPVHEIYRTIIISNAAHFISCRSSTLVHFFHAHRASITHITKLHMQ